MRPNAHVMTITKTYMGDNMTKMKVLVCTLAWGLSSLCFAGFPCRSDMPESDACPRQPAPYDPPELPGSQLGSYSPNRIFAEGYFEIQSPNCSQVDLAAAIEKAKDRMVINAHEQMVRNNFDDLQFVRISDVQLIKKCMISKNGTSYKGLSWVIEAFALYGEHPGP
jgi:hypothetical protein